MYYRIFLVCAAVLAVCSAQGDDSECSAEVMKTATDIFNDQCPEFLGMFRDPEFYAKCIEDHGFTFYESSTLCNSKPMFGNVKTNNTLKTIVNACFLGTGKDYLCCLITEELKTKPVEPQEKYDVSKECIKNYYEKYPKIY